MAEKHPERHSDVGKDCPGELTRVFQAAVVKYKGSGFYTTDKALYGTTPGDYESDDHL